MLSVKIAGVGHAVPQKILKNDDFVAMGIDTSDEWIRTRTGIRERRIASEGESLVTLGSEAIKNAARDAHIDLKEVELIVVATLTPDRPMPSAGCALQKELGLAGIPAFDVYAACSGFIYGLNIAEGLMRARGYKCAVVVGAERLSSVTDWTDRTTCVLFGDGAGAAVLRASDEPKTGIIDSLIGADGALGENLILDHGGKIRMKGKEIYKSAVTAMVDGFIKLLERNKLTPEDIKLVIPHQANSRIIEGVSERIGVPMERFFVNVDKYGNTSAASIPLALSEASQARQPKKGDYLILVAFGGGLTWGASLIRWG
jgi:3-oxoacyl-[acyl-carrier-protein] synthase III